MKKNISLTLAAVLIASAGGAWWWSGQRQQQTVAKAAGNGAQVAAPALVTLAAAQKQTVPVTVEVNGSVVSLNSVPRRGASVKTRSAERHAGQASRAG